eukprot:8479563-Pyramimonas_sp.AAC.1
MVICVRLKHSGSELGPLLELGPRNYSYPSRHLDRLCRCSVLSSSCSIATQLVCTRIDPESSGAF